MQYMSTAFTVRVPDELLASVKAASKAGGVTFTSYVVGALWQRLAIDEPAVERPTRGPLPKAPEGALRARVRTPAPVVSSSNPSDSEAYLKARADLEAAVKADCRHPMARRLGTYCGGCGKELS